MKIAKYDYIKGSTSLQYIYSPPPVDPASLWANPAYLRANSGSMGANYRGRKGADNRARVACTGDQPGPVREGVYFTNRTVIMLLTRGGDHQRKCKRVNKFVNINSSYFE